MQCISRLLDLNDRESEKNISNIQRLIGGTFFFPHYFNIIESQKYDESKKIMNNEENFNKTFNKIKIKIKGEKDC
jgi:hypothetical protein